MFRVSTFNFTLVLTVAFLLLLSPALMRAQATSTITGTVTDPSGAVVSNAIVTLTNPSTEASQIAHSNGAGRFSFPGLSVGTYDLKVSAHGFKLYKTRSLVLNEAQVLGANVTLQVGSSTQSITVRGNALSIQTQTNEISTLITGKQILQLAVNGRHPIELATLGTGVTTSIPSFDGVVGNTAASAINFNAKPNLTTSGCSMVVK